jgi:methylenetetrahydrofolate reductase (NADPH)
MNLGGTAALATTDERKQAVIDLVEGFSIETTPGSATKIPDYREHLRPGTSVAVTFLPGSDFADTVVTARRLREEGFDPAPHLAARSIPTRAAFEDFLKRLRGEAAVTHVLVLAGALDEPLGDFENSMQLLETGLLDKHGITRIGVAGHPEGSSDISPDDLKAALDWKNAFAQRSDAAVYIATQFCFQAAPIIAWDQAIRAQGNTLPIQIGVPGLATLKTLINHAKACGIGPSMRFLTRQARNMAKLLTVSAPDRLLLDLARCKASDPGCGIRGIHVYPLGGLKKSAEWTYAVADGAFTVRPDGKGFTVHRKVA